MDAPPCAYSISVSALTRCLRVKFSSLYADNADEMDVMYTYDAVESSCEQDQQYHGPTDGEHASPAEVFDESQGQHWPSAAADTELFQLHHELAGLRATWESWGLPEANPTIVLTAPTVEDFAIVVPALDNAPSEDAHVIPSASLQALGEAPSIPHLNVTSPSDDDFDLATYMEEDSISASDSVSLNDARVVAFLDEVSTLPVVVTSPSDNESLDASHIDMIR